MKSIDLNADIGESDTPEWAAAELAILACISSANIACGGHAGNITTMQTTVQNAIAKQVTIGAHPAYPDRENFGRVSKILGKDISADALKQSLNIQITTLMEITRKEGYSIAYVKPHGALYNDAVKTPAIADLIAETIARIDPNLIFMGAPESEMTKAATHHNLTFIAEGFIDRRYTDDGHLQSRTIEGAVIKEQKKRLQQAERLAIQNCVITDTGQTLLRHVQSLCVHGDSTGAVETARHVRERLEALGLTIQSFAKNKTLTETIAPIPSKALNQ